MEWINFDMAKEYPEFNTIDSRRLMIKCDDGNVYRFDEDYGMNIVTHFLFLPSIPES